MGIVTVCRTLNEERNIELFCEEYSKISDLILIVDGGSEDKTIELAESFDKVKVANFIPRVEKDGIWRNPHGLHLNYMFYWAIAQGAEWIIYDDCDSLPNANLKKALPKYFGNPDIETIMVRRLYIYKDEGHFPEMTEVGFAKWAWRTNIRVRASEKDPWNHHMEHGDGACMRIEAPCCLLHYSWPDDEEIERKAAFYKIAKSMEDGQKWSPPLFGGKLEALPEYAKL